MFAPNRSGDAAVGQQRSCPAKPATRPQITSEEHLNVRFVVYPEKAGSRSLSRLDQRSRAAGFLELGKLAGLCVNLNRPGMLLDDDVMAEREAKTGSLARRLSREEGVEYFVPDLRRNPRTVIADADLHPVTEIFRRRRSLGT